MQASRKHQANSLYDYTLTRQRYRFEINSLREKLNGYFLPYEIHKYATEFRLRLVCTVYLYVYLYVLSLTLAQEPSEPSP